MVEAIQTLLVADWKKIPSVIFRSDTQTILIGSQSLLREKIGSVLNYERCSLGFYCWSLLLLFLACLDSSLEALFSPEGHIKSVQPTQGFRILRGKNLISAPVSETILLDVSRLIRSEGDIFMTWLPKELPFLSNKGCCLGWEDPALHPSGLGWPQPP